MKFRHTPDQEESVGLSNELGSLDLSVALARVGGDMELLREIAQIFLDQCPDALGEIREAIETGDAHALEQAAHALKGSVANFGAENACAAAYKLEAMGRTGELNGSNGALQDLEAALSRLKPELVRLAAG